MSRIGRIIPETLRALCRRPATEHYPAVPPRLPAHFRGQILFNPAACIGCKRCQRDCPASCLAIIKTGDKQFQAVFQLDQCIFCGQCVDSCPRQALELTAEFELARLRRGELQAVFPPPAAAAANNPGHAQPPPPAGA